MGFPIRWVDFGLLKRIGFLRVRRWRFVIPCAVIGLVLRSGATPVYSTDRRRENSGPWWRLAAFGSGRGCGFGGALAGLNWRSVSISDGQVNGKMKFLPRPS